jgi:hypothetical protein
VGFGAFVGWGVCVGTGIGAVVGWGVGSAVGRGFGVVGVGGGSPGGWVDGPLGGDGAVLGLTAVVVLDGIGDKPGPTDPGGPDGGAEGATFGGWLPGVVPGVVTPGPDVPGVAEGAWDCWPAAMLPD